jgi:hypothetical protein
MQVLDHYPVTIRIDGDELRLKIARFDLEAYSAFKKADEANQRAAKRAQMLVARLQTSDEEPLGDLLARLELDEPEKFAEVQKARDASEASNAQFMTEMFGRFVRVLEGQLSGTTGEVDGTAILRFYAGRNDVRERIYAEILWSNTMPAVQKNALLSRLDSRPSSTAPEAEAATAAPGREPEPTATPAEPKASASPEAATEPSESASSGSTVRLH